MNHYEELCQYVERSGKILELGPTLLKVRHPSKNGEKGSTIYSYTIPSHKESDLQIAAERVMRNIRGTL